MNKEKKILDISLANIGESYGKFRQTKVVAGSKLEKSMLAYGQLSPIVVYPADQEMYEIVDGFKRLRIAQKLDSFTSLRASVLNLGPHASKAAIVKLNWANKSISPYEEAMIVSSLFNDDCLSQMEIAKLFERDKSWVSRRISLVSQLIDEIKEQIKLGLLSISAGKELARLPRGNQLLAYKSIQKHHLSIREVEKLISQLLSSPRWEYENILYLPMEILDARIPPRPRPEQNPPEKTILKFNKNLLELERYGSVVLETVSCLDPTKWASLEYTETKNLIDRTLLQLKQLTLGLESIQKQLLWESAKIPF